MTLGDTNVTGDTVEAGSAGWNIGQVSKMVICGINGHANGGVSEPTLYTTDLTPHEQTGRLSALPLPAHRAHISELRLYCTVS